MRRHYLGVLVLTAASLFESTLLGRCYGENEALQTEISGFYCTDEPVSHAISLLAKRSLVPINSVIDDMTDPVVTVSLDRATVGMILGNLLTQHPGHAAHEESGTIIILPSYLFHKEAFPLNQKVSKFSLRYESYSMSGVTKYGCFFYLPENPVLNIGLSPIRLNRKPEYPTFPHVRSFTNQSPLEILTTISKEDNQSFYCWRLGADFVKARNKEWAEKKMGPTWWPNPDAPCYSVFWGTDWPEVRPSQ